MTSASADVRLLLADRRIRSRHATPTTNPKDAHRSSLGSGVHCFGQRRAEPWRVRAVHILAQPLAHDVSVVVCNRRAKRFERMRLHEREEQRNRKYHAQCRRLRHGEVGERCNGPLGSIVDHYSSGLGSLAGTTTGALVHWFTSHHYRCYFTDGASSPVRAMHWSKSVVCRRKSSSNGSGRRSRSGAVTEMMAAASSGGSFRRMELRLHTGEKKRSAEKEEQDQEAVIKSEQTKQHDKRTWHSLPAIVSSTKSPALAHTTRSRELRQTREQSPRVSAPAATVGCTRSKSTLRGTPMFPAAAVCCCVQKNQTQNRKPVSE